MMRSEFVTFAFAIYINCISVKSEYEPSCVEIFGGTSDLTKCGQHCNHEVNPECRINLLDVKPEISAPLLNFLNSSDYLGCFIAEHKDNSIDYLGRHVHVVTVCRPGGYCHNDLHGDHKSFGCGPSNEKWRCHDDFCNYESPEDLQILESILHHKATTQETTTPTTTPSRTTASTTSKSTFNTTMPTAPLKISTTAMTAAPIQTTTFKTFVSATKSTVNDSTTTTATSVHKCYQCGSIENRTACGPTDVVLGSLKECRPGLNFCQTDVFNDGHGKREIYKRCVDEQTCRTKWLLETSDTDECFDVGNQVSPLNMICHFCCRGDGCNTNIIPALSTLYK